MSHHSYRPNRYNLHYVHSGHGMSVDWWALGILLFEMIAGHPPFYDTNAFGIYQRVLDGHVTFSNLFTAQAKALIKALLKPDRTKRLGCTSTGGNGVRRHKWFSSTNWVALQNCQVQAPHAPTLTSQDDTSCFDNYPDSEEDLALPLEGNEQRLFEVFEGR